jgi:hypothetical protein
MAIALRHSRLIPSGMSFVGYFASALLLDTYPNASFAYSFRKLRTAYAGSAVRIRRSSDNAEADIGFSGSDFDTAAAAAHIGGGSGFIVTWYDQSGNSKNVTQATTTNQPLYTDTGFASKPSADFDGSAGNDSLQLPAQTLADLFGAGQTYSMFACVAPDDVSDANLISWNTATGSEKFFQINSQEGGDIVLDYGTIWGTFTTGRTRYAHPGDWETDPHILQCFRDTSDNQSIVVDGSALGSETESADLDNQTATLMVGTNVSGITEYNGDLAELVFWPVDLGTTNRAAVRTNINAYYSVF